MNPDEQRIAIAEACGWHFNNDPKIGMWVRPSGHFEINLPDYLNDLNAMHEAEKVLEIPQIKTYGAILREMTRGGDYVSHLDRSWHATAAQRAEAFLKTIGKWKEPTTRTEGEGV